MEFTRTKNSGRTFVFGIIEKITLLFLPFVVRTVVIKMLGVQYAGLSSLFTSILSVLSIAELGFGAAIIFCLYEPVARDDNEKICALINYLRKIYKVVAGIILLIGLALMPLLPWLIKGTVPGDINIYILYGIYLLNSFSTYIGFAYKDALFSVYQRGDISHKIRASVEVIKCSIQCLCLILFKNYYFVVGALLFSSILQLFLIGIISKKVFPHIKPKGKLDEATKKTIKSKVAFLSLHSLTSITTSSIDNIVISAFMGLAAIGIYGNYTYISSAVLGFVMVVYSSLRPSIGNYLLTNTRDDNLKLHKAASFVSFCLSTWSTTCMVCLYQPFIKMWIGNENLLPFSAMVMISFFFYFNARTQFYTMCYVHTTGLWNKTLLPKIIASVINLLIDLFTVKTFGVHGIVFGSLITYAFILYPADVLVVYKHVLKENIGRAIVKILIETIGACLIVFGTYLLCTLISGEGISHFIKILVVCSSVPSLFLIVCSLRNNTMPFFISHIKKLLKRG